VLATNRNNEIVNLKFTLLASVLVLATSNAVSAPINIDLTGTYFNGLTEGANIRVLATFQSDSNQIDSLRVDFSPPFAGATSFSLFYTAFSLTSSTSNSVVNFSPSVSGGLGYVQLRGYFEQGMNYLPNGIAAGGYEIGVSFDPISIDKLTSQPLSLHAYAAGASISTQIGDYGYSIDNPVFQISSVPEPETYALMLAGLGLISFMVRRRGQISPA
jgi:hypothetical protein